MLEEEAVEPSAEVVRVLVVLVAVVMLVLEADPDLLVQEILEVAVAAVVILIAMAALQIQTEVLVDQE